MRLNSDEKNLHIFDEVSSPRFHPEKGTIPLLVEAPSFSLSKLSKIRLSVYSDLLMNRDKFDRIVTPGTCEKISKCMCHTLNYPLNKFTTIYNSLYRSFLMREVNPKSLFQMAVRISGNMEYIRSDKVIPVWMDTNIPVWVPVEVLGSTEFYGMYRGKELTVFVTAGIPAGMSVIQKMSNKFIKYMLREIGYPKYAQFDAGEAYNTRFTCNLVKNKGAAKMVAFSVSNSQKKHNNTLYHIRHGDCNIECVDCLNGLDECPGALHKVTYILGNCAEGHPGVMKPGNETCNQCIETDRWLEAKDLFEKRKVVNNGEKEKEVGDVVHACTS